MAGTHGGGDSPNGAAAPESVVRFLNGVRERIGTVVVGQDAVVERILIALLTSGHLLLEGVPGLAKTLLVSCLAKSIHLQFARIQFTIDLLPSDILGSEILDQRTNEFRVNKGPVFTNLLLADEINRAAPKVQSALLEAMQERKATIGKEAFKLPSPFLVIATQNPVEQAGTFELPEAQLDRFMLRHRLRYPTLDEEREVLKRNLALGVKREGGGAVARTEFDVLDEQPVGTIDDLIVAMEVASRVHVSDTFVEHVLDAIHRTRSHPDIELGASPRAGISLLKAAKARALIRGRGYVVPDDLYALAPDVILHRIRLNYEALADGKTGEQVLQELLHDLTRGKKKVTSVS
ncbi:ATPase family associated with various cellular activities (AAA) [Gemmata obscuriglobus]|uniref:MoxR family ATPase n=1 Tax=Gemmata obscuriglobus TaxID=114 RepID=A0A2Z3GYV4_9BACT|nr:MoxR family ATPase [Gemmata obscuriglobus]AWM37841.1 MoxR family ATPase [Gemmata obscuriglobus]QEG29328.1 ATPase family associated with various cellular activities (AAA) [Gemmata obscuriglobus]VTS08329.1 atpase aaa : ATPase associated with various cellular activities AAA_3 OS=Isosphaera pallida (strain ATCC 43644 / DSM 9630 / IS1B) GN=Isop_3567 PE=4 SV=1: AAA_3 [Gemmata obscuriglobus UQM 2246]